MQAPQVAFEIGGTQRSPARILYETLIILVVVVGAQLVNDGLGTLATFLAIAYILIERKRRNRAWDELGLTIVGVKQSLRRNWHLILLVSVVIQFVVVWSAKSYWPALLDHIIARVPFDLTQLLGLLPMLLLATLMEELLYRGLFQERLSWFMPLPAAIALVTLVFGLAHFAQGDALIVAVDIALVMLDSALYGVIFARGKNLLVAWLAHFAADLLAILFIFWL